MPVTFIEDGDLFEDSANVYVCPVNCVGVPGKGLARQFRHRFPTAMDRYVYACRTYCLFSGNIMITNSSATQPDRIVFAATKQHWRDDSKLFDVASCLTRIHEYLSSESAPKSIAIPALGCGLGKLPWEDVRKQMQRFHSLDGVDVRIYHPQ